MSLTELVNPVFLFVAAFRRKIRRGVRLDFGDVRREILAVFSRIEGEANKRGMAERWGRAKIALVYLVDEAAHMETWPGQVEWNNHSLEVEYLNHAQKMRGAWFFDEEYKHVIESGDTEKMQIIYTCLCLGFEGKHRGYAQQLKNHIENIYGRLPGPYVDPDREEKMFPKCYFVDPVKNDPRTPMRVATVLTVFLGVLISYIIGGNLLYGKFVSSLETMATELQRAP